MESSWSWGFVVAFGYQGGVAMGLGILGDGVYGKVRSGS